MKKLSAIVLALLVVITAFPAAAFAHSDDESVCDSGSCWTISFDTQSMGMEQLKNARGLGNYVVEDGRHIKSRTLFRSGALCDASESDLDDLQHEYHISCIIDLRTLSEAEAHPDPAVKGARIISCPVNRVRLATDPENQKSFAKVFQALLQADGRPVLFHDTDGCDQAGFVSALILSALGAGEDTILSDYRISNEYFGSSVVSEPSFQALLRFIDIRYGGMDSYLTNTVGVSGKDVHRLRNAYLEKS